MANYAAMYKKLFQSQTQAITLLQKAQLDTEEMYASAPDEPRALFFDRDDDPPPPPVKPKKKYRPRW